MMVSAPTQKVVVKSEEERWVLGECYFVNQPDTQRDFTEPEFLRKIAHKFLMSGKVNKIDRSHDRNVSGNLIAESFIVRGSNDPDGFAEGAWVIGAYIKNDMDWAKVKSGEWNGWSWSGDATVVPVLKEVDWPVRMIGDTEPFPVIKSETGEQQHFHKVDVSFDEDGAVVPTRTGPAFYIGDSGDEIELDDHSHPVEKTTATGPELGHSHRLLQE